MDLDNLIWNQSGQHVQGLLISLNCNVAGANFFTIYIYKGKLPGFDTHKQQALQRGARFGGRSLNMNFIGFIVLNLFISF